MLLLLPLGLSAASANNRCAVVASAVCECSGFRLLCVRARVRMKPTRVSWGNGMRFAVYLVLLFLLLQLRLLRVLVHTAAATAADAVCHGYLKVGLAGATNNHYQV